MAPHLFRTSLGYIRILVPWLTWFVIGVAFTVSLLAVPSFGLLSLPVIGLFAWVVLRWSSGIALLGAVAGAAVTLCAVGVTSEPYRSCPEVTPTTVAGESYTCGGIPPELLVGMGGSVLALLFAYGAATRLG